MTSHFLLRNADFTDAISVVKNPLAGEGVEGASGRRVAVTAVSFDGLGGRHSVILFPVYGRSHVIGVVDDSGVVLSAGLTGQLLCPDGGLSDCDVACLSGKVDV